MPKFYRLLLPACLLTHSALAQSRPLTDSARVVVLSDVAVRDKITRLVVASGELKHNHYHVMGPGGGYAVRFRAPRGDYHQLSQLLVHLVHPGSIQEGSLRVRVASVSAAGGPADDDLLATPVLLTTAALQRARHHLTLTWPPGQRVVVPMNGFFLVLECLGQQPDDYISRMVPPTRPKQMPMCEISRRDHPEVPSRVVGIEYFPHLAGATPAATEAESWLLDTKTRAWRVSRNPTSVIFVEAVFE